MMLVIEFNCEKIEKIDLVLIIIKICIDIVVKVKIVNKSVIKVEWVVWFVILFILRLEVGIFVL